MAAIGALKASGQHRRIPPRKRPTRTTVTRRRQFKLNGEHRRRPRNAASASQSIDHLWPDTPVSSLDVGRPTPTTSDLPSPAPSLTTSWTRSRCRCASAITTRSTARATNGPDGRPGRSFQLPWPSNFGLRPHPVGRKAIPDLTERSWRIVSQVLASWTIAILLVARQRRNTCSDLC
jgi:hypothetical protein